jgi:nucleoside-diphosphate-sugar epimerase
MTSFGGSRCLVTGADGFIGSHLVERLAELGADVRAFCMYNFSGLRLSLTRVFAIRSSRLRLPATHAGDRS